MASKCILVLINCDCTSMSSTAMIKRNECFLCLIKAMPWGMYVEDRVPNATPYMPTFKHVCRRHVTRIQNRNFYHIFAKLLIHLSRIYLRRLRDPNGAQANTNHPLSSFLSPDIEVSIGMIQSRSTRNVPPTLRVGPGLCRHREDHSQGKRGPLPLGRWGAGLASHRQFMLSPVK